MTVVELKALAYDLYLQLKNIQRDIASIEALIEQKSLPVEQKKNG